MTTVIKTKNSITTLSSPTGLSQGELAVNITDRKMWIGDNSGNSIQLLGSGSTNIAGGSNTQVQYNSSGALAGSSNMTFDGTTLTAAAFSGPHNGTVGASTPNTGAFTTLTTSSTVTINGGTANGVAYLNGSKVLTSGSALTFDGTNFATTGSATATRFVPTGSTVATNGLYLATTNALGFSTNSTERMRLDASGNLGIGTSSPNYPLVVRSTGTSTSFAGNITARLETNGSGYNSTLQFSNNVDASVAIGLVGSALGFGIGTTERMRLDSSGNLGLGVTPSAGNFITLQTQRAVITGGANDRSEIAYNYYRTSGVDTYIGTDYATRYRQITGQHIWYTAPSGTGGTAVTFTQAMTLDASGNLGVGTTSPNGYRLNVTNSARIGAGGYTDYSYRTLYIGRNPFSATTSIIHMNPSSGNNNYGFDIGVSDNDTAGNQYFWIGDNRNTERMRIDSSGNLLVGTTSTPTTAAKVIAMGNATAPTASITGGVLYVEGGALKFRGSSGTVTTIAPA